MKYDKPEVGQIVFVTKRSGDELLRVNKVGRAYFYAGEQNYKINLKTWKGEDYFVDFAYPDKAIYDDWQRKCQIEQKLYKCFCGNHGNTDFTTEQLEEVIKVLGVTV